MGKRDIPIPKRPDEFTDLETELIEAIENIETHTRAVEDMLVSYIKADEPSEEISEESMVGDETVAIVPDQNGAVQPDTESAPDEAISQTRDENENDEPADEPEVP